MKAHLSSPLTLLHTSEFNKQEHFNGFVKIAHDHGMPISKGLAYRLVYECTKRQDVELGRQVWSLIVQTGFAPDSFLSNHILRLLASSGNWIEANQVFNQTSTPDQYTWNAVIQTHARYENCGMVLQLYYRMQQIGRDPDKFTVLSVMKACTSKVFIEQGRAIYEQIIQNGLKFDIVVGSTIVDMYAKLGTLEEASRTFDNLTNKNIVSWNAMIAGYSLHAKGHLALQCFYSLDQKGIGPSKVTFLNILKGCCSTGSIEQTKCIHVKIMDSSIESDIVIGNALLDTYVRCGSLEEACRVFNNLKRQDVVSWGTMIAGYTQFREEGLALDCFHNMEHKGIKPSKATFLSILKATGNVGAIEQGRCINEQIICSGIPLDVVMGSAIVDMYTKCNSFGEACRIFESLLYKNIVSWNSIISGYAQHGEGCLALEVFDRMQSEGIMPDKVTFSSSLKACSSIGILEKGRQIHVQIVEHGLQSNVVVGSSLVDMYVKCRSVEEASRVFARLPYRNVVSWNSIIAGYRQVGKGHVALECFHAMQHQGVQPDKVTFLSILKACSNVNAIEQGRYMHEKIDKVGLQSDIVVGSTLVDMYAKCGSVNEACEVFDMLPYPDVVSWSAIIMAYAQIGEAGLAVQKYIDMQNCGIKPNDAIWLGVLTAISHIGLVDEGIWYFRIIQDYHGTDINILHIACMLDLLGRRGYFKEAEVVLSSAMQPHICLWMALLNACIIHCNIELAKQCFDVIISLNPLCAAAYILMSNLYASAVTGEPCSTWTKPKRSCNPFHGNTTHAERLVHYISKERTH